MSLSLVVVLSVDWFGTRALLVLLTVLLLVDGAVEITDGAGAITEGSFCGRLDFLVCFEVVRVRSGTPLKLLASEVPSALSPISPLSPIVAGGLAGTADLREGLMTLKSVRE